MSTGNPRISLRLPEDHWLWEIDSNKRTLIIKQALDYFKNRIDREQLPKTSEEDIKRHIDKAKEEILRSLEKVAPVTDQKLEENDMRNLLAKDMDKFLEF